MSATIATKDLSFFIFGSGHDYTRADSGAGDGARFFSHPFMPKGSRAYREQYRLYVPDDEGNIINAPDADLAHCTFEPALGDTFDTEGEVEIKLTYHHEYQDGDVTKIVHKEVAEKIVVVDHGAVVTSATLQYQRDIYSDGYIFWHPFLNAPSNIYRSDLRAVTKTSSLPWNAKILGGGGSYYFISSASLTDISELAFADVSKVTDMRGLFKNCYSLSDISALKDWDVSIVRYMNDAFNGCSALSDISPLANWNLSGCNNISGIFSMCQALEDLTPLKDWDVSRVTDMSSAFFGVTDADLTGISDWDVSNVQTMERMFCNASNIDLDPISGWDVSNVQSFKEMFSECRIYNVDALAGWMTYRCTNMSYMFHKCQNLTDISGLSDWYVYSVVLMNSMFSYCSNLADISPIANWNTLIVRNMDAMFSQTKVKDIQYLNGWNFSAITTMTGMFYLIDASPLDASPASTWNVSGTGMKAFDEGWSNRPSWN